MDALNKIQQEVEQEKERLSQSQGESNVKDDEEAVARALGTSVDGVVSNFGNQRIAKLALGSTKVFNVNNEARVSAALQSIFS